MSFFRFTILDRYLTKLLLLNAALLMVFLAVMIVAVDFSLNFDEYSGLARRILEPKGQADFVRTGLLALWLALDLWWPRLFLLAGYLLGPVLVGAIGFTCAQLVRGRELVAMVAAGLPLLRVARPFVLVTLVLLGAQLINRELVLPALAPLLTRDKQEAGGRSMGAMSDLAIDGQRRLIYARNADLDTSTIQGLWVWERDAAGLMRRRITAPTATFSQGAWRLTDGLAIDRVFEDPRAGAGAQLRQTPVATLESDLDPTALKLRRFRGMASNLSTAQLSELIARYRAGEPTEQARRRIDQLERLRWGRFSALACTLLSVLMAFPFFLRKEPANMLTQSLIAAPVALASLALTLVGVTAAIPGLPPQLSVLVPAMVLAPLAIAAVSSVRS